MTTPNHAARPARLALLGCGTIGAEVARRLLSGWMPGARLAACLVRDSARARPIPPGETLFSSSIGDVLASRPDLVIECLGGVEPAASHVADCLERALPVITANKSMLAHRGDELATLARLRRAELAYEASVAAGIPLLASLRHLRGDRILAIRGVINGSCNFILTRLASGMTFENALDGARARGLVEPDPEADLSGRDCAEKLVVLARVLEVPGVDLSSVRVRGIESITRDDAERARRAGYALKLVAELDAVRGIASVAPALVSRDHPLAGVPDEENGIIIETELAGEIFLRGRGAGPEPTASAILGDAARILQTQAASRGVAPAPSPPRRHVVHVPGATSPDEVLRAAAAHGITPTDIAIDRDSTRVCARAADASALEALVRDLAPRGANSRGMMLEVIESPARARPRR